MGLACANGTAKAANARVALGANKTQALEQPLHEHTSGLMHSFAEPLFWVAAALCIVAELLILRSAFAPPRDAGVTAGVPQSPRGTEMIWAVIPAIILAALLAATWRAIH